MKPKTAEARSHLPIMGWREWLALPDLGIPAIKVKIDTGARSSALHAFDIHSFEHNGQTILRFKIHPFQRNSHQTIMVEAPLLDQREVRNSGGQAELRPVISTTVQTRDQQWPIELTLTNRDVMGFRMLLGRQAVRDRFLVDAGASYLQGHEPTVGQRSLE